MNLIIGNADLAKYPFLGDVKNYLQERGFSIDEIGSKSEFTEAINFALHRLMCAIKGVSLKESDMAIHNDMTQIFSFGIAMLLLKIVNFQYFIRKFALSEAIRSELYLQNDVTRSNSDSIILKIMKDLFAYDLTVKDRRIHIPASLYLKHSTQFNEPVWKLVNREVRNGFVVLTIHEAVRLIRRDVTDLIIKKINNAPPITLYDTHGVCKFPLFEEPVKLLKEKMADFDFARADSTDVPPCVEDALKVMENGNNLSHSGRFMVASFFLSRGYSVDDIAQMFAGAPDFNLNTTKYQLQMIERGQYKCPGCNKLNAQNLCKRTAECGKIINPLQFRRHAS